jgi:electron transport complex protein RnfG
MTEQALEPAYKKRIGYQGTLLGGFATLAATLLVMGNIGSFDTIQQRIAEDLQASLSQVVPHRLHDNNLLDNQIHIQHEQREVVVYQGIKNHQATAVAFGISGQGYAGEISLIMGVDPGGEILGVRVLSHAETPGLGDKIESAKDDWIFHFDGLSFDKLAEEKWQVKKDGGVFDQFSGATITPRGVVKAIREGLLMFRQHRDELLKVATDPDKKTGEKNPGKQKAPTPVKARQQIPTGTVEVEGNTHE